MDVTPSSELHFPAGQSSHVCGGIYISRVLDQVQRACGQETGSLSTAASCSPNLPAGQSLQEVKAVWVVSALKYPIGHAKQDC